MPYKFVFEAVLRYWPNYLRGLVVTGELTVASIFFGSVLGLATAMARLSSIKPLKVLAFAYIELVRGIPALVLLLWLYYGLAILTGLALPGFQAGVTALSVYVGAYLAETFRAGILAVPRGQGESALALGMSAGQVYRYITLPQAAKIVIPPYGNSLIGLLKDTSLVSVIAIAELLREAQFIAVSSLRTFESYTVAAVMYLIVTTFIAAALRRVEKVLAVG
jgi:His/Glu/Gln/Arg/opine family amino acid ABC transporter permease subunit